MIAAFAAAEFESVGLAVVAEAGAVADGTAAVGVLTVFAFADGLVLTAAGGVVALAGGLFAAGGVVGGWQITVAVPVDFAPVPSISAVVVAIGVWSQLPTPEGPCSPPPALNAK